MWIKRVGFPYKDLGLFILRAGIGAVFFAHGYPKLKGGVSTWEILGQAIGVLGIHWYPAFWGLVAAFFETLGGLCLITGIFFRTACLALMSTMMVALLWHLKKGDGFQQCSYALSMLIVFVGLYFTGAGRYGFTK